MKSPGAGHRGPAEQSEPPARFWTGGQLNWEDDDELYIPVRRA